MMAFIQAHCPYPCLFHLSEKLKPCEINLFRPLSFSGFLYIFLPCHSTVKRLVCNRSDHSRIPDIRRKDLLFFISLPYLCFLRKKRPPDTFQPLLAYYDPWGQNKTRLSSPTDQFDPQHCFPCPRSRCNVNPPVIHISISLTKHPLLICTPLSLK